MVFLSLSLLPLSSASVMEGDVYSVDSSHLGSAGGVLTGDEVTSRSTLTYQQPGNKDASSTSYLSNLGWFKQPSEAEVAAPAGGGEEEEGVPSGGGGGGARILFDVDILEFDSPAKLGDFLDFTYLVKGVGSINDDVTIDFWIEKDGEIITSGSTMVYLGVNEETIKTASLFLPEDIDSGEYKFVVQVSFQGVKGEAHRSISLEVKDGDVFIQKLFDISFSLDDTVIQSSDELIAVATFENFGDVPTTVDMTFVILDEFGNEVYREKGEILVITEEVLRKKFLRLDLPEGKYTFVFSTLYNVDVFDEFIQEFEIVEGIGLGTHLRKNWIWYLIGLIISGLSIWIIILIVKRRKKKKDKKIAKKIKYFDKKNSRPLKGKGQKKVKEKRIERKLRKTFIKKEVIKNG